MRTTFNPDIDYCPICNKQLEQMNCVFCNIEWIINKKKSTVNGISDNRRKITITYDKR